MFTSAYPGLEKELWETPHPARRWLPRRGQERRRGLATGTPAASTFSIHWRSHNTSLLIMARSQKLILKSEMFKVAQEITS